MTATVIESSPRRAEHPHAPAGCPQPAGHGVRYPVVFTASQGGEYVASARMSFEEFLDLDTEGGLAEWVDGEVFLYMSVKLYHDRIVSFLHAYMAMVVTYLGLGTVHLAGYAIKAPSGRAGREPDLFALKPQNSERLGHRFLDGVPDLIVEVVSDDSPSRDRVVKFAEYEADGVPEYWIIDPRPGEERADFYVLVDGAYVGRSPDAGGVYESAVFPGLKLRPEWLFRDPAPLTEALAFALGPGFGPLPSIERS